MIQRKQTIYLFFAGLLPLVLLFTSLGDLTMETAYYKYTAFSVYEASKAQTFILSTVGNAVLLIATSLLSFITIFLYKNRKAQIKLISLNMLIILLAIIAITYIYPNLIFLKHPSLAETKIEYNVAISACFVSAIGLFLSKKAVMKDEALVRSANRLR